MYGHFSPHTIVDIAVDFLYHTVTEFARYRPHCATFIFSVILTLYAPFGNIRIGRVIPKNGRFRI